MDTQFNSAIRKVERTIMQDGQSFSAEKELELKALKYIARIQNTFTEMNDIQINIIRYIQLIFQAY